MKNMEYSNISCFKYYYVVLVLVLLLLTLLSLLGAKSVPITLADDESSLLEFKSRITYDPGNVLASNWTTNTSVCDWIGISCGRRHRRVTALNLTNMGLQGTIPPAIGNLSFLRSLDLSYNGFGGAIPRQLFSSRRLRLLRLISNKLSGPIPWEAAMSNVSSLEVIRLGNNSLSGLGLPNDMCRHLTKLRVLTLTENQLHGAVPSSLGDCTNLQVLSIQGNFFGGPIPSTIGNLTSLQELYFRENNLTGELPQELSNLNHLREVYLGENNLRGALPYNLFNSSTLRVIYFSFNQLSGELPPTLGQLLPNLVGLYLASNELSGRIPISIGNASNIADLDLGDNSFSGIIPDSIAHIRMLNRLFLLDNHLESSPQGERSIFTTLAKCEYLNHVFLNDNPLNVVLQNSIGNFSSLQYFSASNCGINGVIPQEIDELGNNIIYIDLGGNNLVGSIPPNVSSLAKLQVLSLERNKFQGPIPPSLCHLKRLFKLSLSHNRLVGPIPECFGNLDSLRYLYLADNKLTSTIPYSLWSLADMLEIFLNSNSLNGTIHSSIGNLNSLILLSLSRNQLSGSIPSTIGSLPSLQLMDISENRLEGPIPLSLGKLLSLQSLDLSTNSLSGSIPILLANLTDLTYLNVSFNQLQGKIPDEGCFKRLTNFSFQGNLGLCGPPRFQVLQCKILTQRKQVMKWMRYGVPCIVFAGIFIVTIILIFMARRSSLNKEKTKQDTSWDLLTTTMRRTSYLELQSGTNGFDETNLLGVGGFGSVYKATLLDGYVVAVKVFNMEVEGSIESFDTESQVLSSIRHRNLVRIISCCCNVDMDFKALILEFMPRGSLEMWLYSHNYFLNIGQRLNLMIDVASALEYLHHGYGTPIVHCDLKPSNVLLDEDMVGHVSDFGISKLLGGENFVTRTLTLATIGYMAPEYGLHGNVSIKGDVYSYGILVLETFTRRKPTDEMFSAEMDIRKWVEVSDAMKVVDSNLFPIGELTKYVNAKRECVSSILKVGLDCSATSPEERTGMQDVVAALKKIQSKLQRVIR